MLPKKLKNWLQIRLRNDCLMCDANLIAFYQEPFIAKDIIDFCAQCRKQFANNILCCATCAIPLKIIPPRNLQQNDISQSNSQQKGMSKLVCGACQKQKPLWDKALTCFIYEYPIDRLLIALKHKGRIDYINSIARLLLQDIELEYNFKDAKISRPDCIVPVPLHINRECLRGYNQAYLIARELSIHLACPLQNKLIHRVRHTPRQAQLSKKQRENNLRKAFAINAKENIPKYVALVDDVMTTGSTAHAITKTLLAAGVKRVDVWCVARAE